jgi:hypothetical protein
LLAIISDTRTVDIKSSEDLRNTFVQAKDNLDVTNWILTDDSYGILGADGCCLGQDAIANLTFNLFDFLNRLFFVQAVQEEIDIRGRSEILMVVCAQCTLESGQKNSQ